ncbi:HD-GYP domain-containing protein, partial [Emergencia timonensis]
TTIYALTAAIDAKDHYTFSHSENVAYYSRELAKAYGMNEEGISIVYEAGLLHDIGKIGINEDILNKPGKLTEEEYEVMKTHVSLSIGIIRHLPSLDYVIPAVIGHHERYDGQGYPRGIGGKDIPLMARILCIADSFDAMVSKRSYKAEMAVDKALDIIANEAGRQFDPQLAPIFINLIRDGIIEVR